MQELLLIIACLNGHGCNETTTAYYISNSKTAEQIKAIGIKFKDRAGPTLTSLSAPILFAAKGKGTFKVTNKISLQLSTEGPNMVIFRVNF